MKKYLIVKGQPILFHESICLNGIIEKESGIDSIGYFLVVNDHDEKKTRVICVDGGVSIEISERLEMDEKIIEKFLGVYENHKPIK